MKTCKKCQVIKPLTQFSRYYRTKDGLQSYCKDCNKAVQWKSRYGLTAEEANKILARGCEVCGTKESLRIDHNHTTGRVRGCLCNNCNSALGMLCEDPKKILSLAKYILSKE